MQVSEHLITAPEYNKFYDVVIDASAEQIHGAFQLGGKGGQVPVIETYNRAEKGECGLKCPINYCVGGFFHPPDVLWTRATGEVGTAPLPLI